MAFHTFEFETGRSVEFRNFALGVHPGISFFFSKSFEMYATTFFYYF